MTDYQRHPWKLTPRADLSYRVLRTAPPFPSSVPVILVDGIAGIGFKPRTLFLSCTAPLRYWQAQREYDPSGPVDPGNGGIVPGMMAIELEGLHPGGLFFRRFNIATYRQIKIPIEAFEDVRVRVVDQTGVNYGITAIASDVELGSNAIDPVFCSTEDTDPGLYFTPPGAVAGVSQTSIASFRWVDLHPDQAEQTVITPITAGVRFPVQGSVYGYTGDPGTPCRINWEISLL